MQINDNESVNPLLEEVRKKMDAMGVKGMRDLSNRLKIKENTMYAMVRRIKSGKLKFSGNRCSWFEAIFVFLEFTPEEVEKLIPGLTNCPEEIQRFLERGRKYLEESKKDTKTEKIVNLNLDVLFTSDDARMLCYLADGPRKLTFQEAMDVILALKRE